MQVHAFSGGALRKAERGVAGTYQPVAETDGVIVHSQQEGAAGGGVEGCEHEMAS